MQAQGSESLRRSVSTDIPASAILVEGMSERDSERNPLLDEMRPKDRPLPKKSGWLRVMLAVLVSVAWMVVSSGLIIVNK